MTAMLPGPARIDDRPLDELVLREDWASFDAARQRRYYADNGFLVVPGALSHPELVQIRQDITTYRLRDKTEHLWSSTTLEQQIDNPKVLAALEACFGTDLRFFKGVYVDKEPTGGVGDAPGRTALHFDYGIGEEAGDMRNSCAMWVNVAIYLSDLSPENGPVWVVPGSNHYTHLKPSTDMEHVAPDARMLLARAGDAIMWGGMTVHCGGDNISGRTRDGLFFSYRPAWAKPIGEVPEWPDELIARATPRRRALLLGQNDGLATRWREA